MKIRTGFVSNSSSSSFSIPLDGITGKQLYQIQNHIKYVKKKIKSKSLHYDKKLYLDWAWDIEINSTHIMGYTTMDNFDMRWFLNAIYVQSGVITWGV